LKLNDKNASKLADSGIAVHHGGLDATQRRKVEDGFRDGSIMIIVSTSTLAVGVNLPAHTVIVAGTKHWNGQSERFNCAVSI
jgi:ATP-dependent DNA helicase HFM1/MER3